MAQVPEQQQVVSGGDGEKMVTRAETGEAGIEILSLSSRDKEENLPSSGVNYEVEVAGFPEGSPEKNP